MNAARGGRGGQATAEKPAPMPADALAPQGAGQDAATTPRFSPASAAKRVGDARGARQERLARRGDSVRGERSATQDGPSISVIITCFNYARYLGAAIESVLLQDYPHVELLLVDDGSTDASPDIMSVYAGRARIIRQENQGHIAACNNGFAASNGGIVIFLDADDTLEPSLLSRVAGVWTPSAAKVQYDLKIVDAEGRDLGRRFCYFAADYDAERVRTSFRRTGTYRWPVTVGNAYSRWFLEKVFPLAADQAPDGMLNTVAPVYGEVITIPEALACYRLHGANMWSSSGSDHGRLGKRIAGRRREVRFMREHAEARGAEVPAADALDHELAFVNYRLMAIRLKIDYEGRDADSSARLLRCAYAAALAEGLPVPMVMAHMMWFSLLAVAPRPVALSLYELRARRASLLRAIGASGRALRSLLFMSRGRPGNDVH